MTKNTQRVVEYQLVTEQINGKYAAKSLGKGNYASVYEAKATRPNGSEKLDVEEVVAAKLYLDDATDDYQDVFAHEIEHLKALGSHHHIIGLRRIHEEYPPSFVCETCGLVFHCAECPDCQSGLENGEFNRANPSLRCQGVQRHAFYKKHEDDLTKLASKRSCGHAGPVRFINFLFRPCIFMELLHLNLQEVLENLRTQKPQRGHSINRGDENDDNWRRQKFLMYIWILCQAAEGLAYVHQKERSHGDLSPENIMVKVDAPPYSYRFGAYPIHNTCLIDLGEARSLKDPCRTRPIRGKLNFVAPEKMIRQSSLPSSVQITPESGPFKVGGLSLIHI